jgi:hypothetical protein
MATAYSDDCMTSRRTVLTALAWLVGPASSGAQRGPHRMAYLSFGSFSLNARYEAALLRGLAERGYQEGRNLVIERRSADGNVDRLPGLVAELLALKPDLLFVTGSQGALAASRATKTVPIVFVAVSDPVGMGIVRTLRRPDSKNECPQCQRHRSFAESIPRLRPTPSSHPAGGSAFLKADIGGDTRSPEPVT